LTAQRLERHLAGQPCYSDQAVQSTLRRLRDEISRLTHLLNEFRSLSRREQYNFQPTGLAMIAGEIFATEAENYAAGGIRVEQDFPADLPLVQADRDKLKQALWNLCKNAVEAMPQGGTLTLNAYSSGADVVLEIGDTGVGIPPGVDIFEPFTTTKSSGSGLGLVVVRQIVAAHGGNLTYTSWGRVTDEAFDRLEKTGGLRPRVPQPSVALLAARENVSRLILGWDEGLADRLAADNLYLDESKDRRRAQLAEVVAAHGTCRIMPDRFDVENALRGTWTMSCDRGWLRVSVTLAPTVPPLVLISSSSFCIRLASPSSSKYPSLSRSLLSLKLIWRTT